jgi:hypothetical protein
MTDRIDDKSGVGVAIVWSLPLIRYWLYQGAPLRSGALPVSQNINVFFVGNLSF